MYWLPWQPLLYWVLLLVLRGNGEQESYYEKSIAVNRLFPPLRTKYENGLGLGVVVLRGNRLFWARLGTFLLYAGALIAMMDIHGVFTNVSGHTLYVLAPSLSLWAWVLISVFSPSYRVMLNRWQQCLACSAFMCFMLLLFVLIGGLIFDRQAVHHKQPFYWIKTSLYTLSLVSLFYIRNRLLLRYGQRR